MESYSAGGDSALSAAGKINIWLLQFDANYFRMLLWIPREREGSIHFAFNNVHDKLC